MMIVARYSNDGQPKPLDDHLTSVALIARKKSFFKLYGEIAGLLHDFGKYSKEFQEYINKCQKTPEDYEDHDITGTVDHSSAGAQFIIEIMRERSSRTDDKEIDRLASLIGRMIAHCIAGHHSGLLNGLSSNEGPSLEKRLKKNLDPYKYSINTSIFAKAMALADSLLEEDQLEHVCRWINADADIVGRDAFSLQFAIRMIFSALVDGDRLHSEQSGNPDQWAARQAIQTQSFSILSEKLENHLKTLSSEGNVNRIRNVISDQCRDAANQDQGFFQLTVPTGGGKTLASLRFALHHAVKNNLDRIIYVIPFTSIIDQNAEVFRNVLDADGKTQNVIEHHCNLEPKKETPQSRLIAENWSSPVIVTTNVQFLESLYTNRPSRCRRLHTIRNSVIILDEAQTVPVHYLQAVTWALEELVVNHGCTIVFSTATQPALESHRIDGPEAKDNHRIGLKNIRQIIQQPEKLYKSLKRVNVKPIESENPLTMAEVAGNISKYADKSLSVLSIVNTKKNASKLFHELGRESKYLGRLFHLSTAMCPQHRKEVIEIIKHLTVYSRKIRDYSPILISTQLVEAGVDLDFDVVFRSLAGVDSIAQAAGRCNREGQLLPQMGKTYIYNADENLGSLIDILEAKRAGVNALEAVKNDLRLPIDEKDPLGLITIMEYFERLYWNRRDEMDKEKIVARLAATRQLEQATDIPFADIACDFKIIKNDTVPVLVPYGTSGQRLITHLRNNKPLEYQMTRLAQQHSVQLYRDILPSFQNIIEETPSGWFVVASSVHYGATGLKYPDSIEVEGLIL